MDDYATGRENALLAVQPYVDKLAAFQTAGEIRDFLVNEGIKANPIEARSCAIAEYVHRGSGTPVVVTRTTGVRLVDYLNERMEQLTEVATCTPAMQEFIINFDLRQYPELEA